MNHYDTRYDGVKAFLIARVSDPSQREALPAQKYKLKDYAERLKVDAEYHEFDESAYKEDREKFEKIVDKIYKYPKECIVVFDKIDRFTRDCSSEIVNKLKRTAMDGRIELHFVSDSLVVTKTSPACELFRLDIGMATAGYYSSAIRDNVNRRIDQKLRDGEFPEKAPLGYLNVVTDDGKHEIVIDKMREPFIRQAFEMRLSGESVKDITIKLRAMGLTSNMKKPKPVGASTIAYLFKNKFYYGTMSYRGKDYPHKYATYITKGTYDEIQRISDENYVKKFQNKKKQYEFTFKGILKCGVCGCSMSSYTKKGRVYMRCSNAKGKCPNNATELDVIGQIEPMLSEISISKSLASQICDEINQDHIRAKELREAKENALRAEYARLERRKDAMYEDKLDGRITVDKYDELVEKDAKRMTEIDDELVALAQGFEGSEMTISNLLKLATSADELFKSSKPSVKNQILRLLVSNLKIKEKRLDFNPLEPFIYIKKLDSRPKWLPEMTDFRMACYKYDQVYGDLLAKFVYEYLS